MRDPTHNALVRVKCARHDPALTLPSQFTFLMAFIFGFKYSHKNFAWAALVVVVYAFVAWMVRASPQRGD